METKHRHLEKVLVQEAIKVLDKTSWWNDKVGEAVGVLRKLAARFLDDNLCEEPALTDRVCYDHADSCYYCDQPKNPGCVLCQACEQKLLAATPITTMELLVKAKNELVGYQEFKAAKELVAAIKRIRVVNKTNVQLQATNETIAIAADVESKVLQRYPPKLESAAEAIGRITSGAEVIVQCNHCRGSLSGKLVKDLQSPDRCKDIFRCPNCMQILLTKDLIPG